MPANSTAASRPRLTKEERREHFLDTAAMIVAENGIGALTMESVAARAGVNKALGYRYFTNRDDLLVALFTRETERFDEQVRDRNNDCGSFEEHLRALIEVYLASFEAGAMVMTLEQARLGQGPFEESRRARERQSVAYLAGLIEQYHPLDHRTARTAAAVVAGGAQGVVAICRTTSWPRDEIIDDYLVMCTGAIDAIARQQAAL